MKRQRFIIRDPQILQNCIAFLQEHWADQARKGQPLAVEIKRTNRSIEQNARYWALINLMAEQLVVGGRRYSQDVLHEHCKRMFLGVTALPNGLPMAVSSKGLTVDEFSDYLQAVEVWAVENGVSLPDGW